MMSLPPDGTRFVLPALARSRAAALAALASLYDAWGYEPIEVPALERYDPTHPRADQSFKLSDRDSGVLALRSDFTPASAQLVRAYHPSVADGEHRAMRFRYAGTVWHAIDPEFARTREFTQVGVELVGVSNARADAEIIHLARESVRAVGLTPRVELGNPGFVRVLFDLAGVQPRDRDPLADAIDRKDRSDLRALLKAGDIVGPVAEALLEIPALYGDASVLEEARRVAPWPQARVEIDRVEGVLGEFEDDSELLLDLGMARRLSYYTGVTFRAYTFDFGQPLLGGGRYDGALLPYAAGFSIGLERLLSALPEQGASDGATARVLSTDDVVSRRLRGAGVTVLRATVAGEAAALAEARAHAVSLVVHDGRLIDLAESSGAPGRSTAAAHAAMRVAVLRALDGDA